MFSAHESSAYDDLTVEQARVNAGRSGQIGGAVRESR
jgi:hypothetical protein